MAERTQFEAGDYIIFSEGYAPNDSSYPVNYCFKQLMDAEYLRSIDAEGRSNGWGARPFDPDNYTNAKSVWRYATPDESAEYERMGKPYDVRELAAKDTYSFLGSITLQKDGDTPS